MNKLSKTLAGAGVLALSLGMVAGLAGHLPALAAEPAPAGTDIRSVAPIVSLDFEDASVGEQLTESWNLQHISKENAWDQNYTAGKVVEGEEGFGSKAYRYYTTETAGAKELGGVKATRATPGNSYELTMKMKFEKASFLYVEYVANDYNAAQNPKGSIYGWGCLEVYPDGHITSVNMGNNESTNNVTNFKYDTETHEFKMTFTAGIKIWDANTTEPGFVKFTMQDPEDGACLTIDDVAIKETSVLLNEDFENTNSDWAAKHFGSGENVEHGDGNRAFKMSGELNGGKTWLSKYLNKLGFLRVDETYRISFDYEFTNLQTVYVNWNGKYGSMADFADIMGVTITTTDVKFYGYPASAEAEDVNSRRYDLDYHIDEQNSNKGSVAFTFKQLGAYVAGDNSQIKMVLYGNGSGEADFFLDNLKIEKLTNEITATSEGGHGKIEAETFHPYKGSDLTVNILPDNGYQLKSFTVDGTDKTGEVANGKYTLEAVDAAHALAAEFETKPIKIEIASPVGATVSTDKDINSYKFGDRVEFTFTVESGYKIVRVLINGEEATVTDNKCVVESAEGDLSVAVVTASTTYTMMHQENEGGAVTVDKDTVQEGDSVTFTVTPDEGYRVKSVKYNNTEVELTADGKYVAENVQKNGKLVVEFEKIPTDPVDPDPGTTDPGTTDPGTTEPGTTEPEPSKKGGCGSAIGAGAALLSVLTVAGVSALLFVRKRKDGRN